MYYNLVLTCSRVSHGVPKGSILGPLLFLSMTLKNSFKKSDANMFADDTTILATNKSLPVLFDAVNMELAIVYN